VSWWVGAERYGGAGLTALLLGAVLARHLSFTFAHTLVCLGHERNVGLVVLADGLVVVAAMVVFIPRWGVLGAPLGSLLGVGLVGLPLLGALLARRPGFSAGALLRAYGPWAWRFAAVTAGLGWLSSAWVPSGLVGLALTASAVSAAYLAVMLPAVVGTPLWDFLGPRLAILRRPLGKAAVVAEPGE
jgi:hypothetical protein